MHFDHDRNKFTCDNLELLSNCEFILGLPCFMPMLKVVHTFMKYVQCKDDFIMNFMDVVNLGKGYLFCFYIDSLSNFDDYLFDDFTKVVKLSNDVLFLYWCSNFIKIHECLLLRLQDICLFSTHTQPSKLFMDQGSWKIFHKNCH